MLRALAKILKSLVGKEILILKGSDLLLICNNQETAILKSIFIHLFEFRSRKTSTVIAYGDIKMLPVTLKPAAHITIMVIYVGIKMKKNDDIRVHMRVYSVL